MRKWYNWPEGYYDKSWKPWYGIVRGIVGLPFIFIGFVLLYIGMVLSDGFSEANSLSQDLY